jgi:hypothetical protein
MLTGDPTTKGADIVGAMLRAHGKNMTSDQRPEQVIRQSCITLIILEELLQLKLIALKPLEIVQFGRAVAQALLAVTEAHVQSQALQRAKNTAR